MTKNIPDVIQDAYPMMRGKSLRFKCVRDKILFWILWFMKISPNNLYRYEGIKSPFVHPGSRKMMTEKKLEYNLMKERGFMSLF